MGSPTTSGLGKPKIRAQRAEELLYGHHVHSDAERRAGVSPLWTTWLHPLRPIPTFFQGMMSALYANRRYLPWKPGFF